MNIGELEGWSEQDESWLNAVRSVTLREQSAVVQTNAFNYEHDAPPIVPAKIIDRHSSWNEMLLIAAPWIVTLGFCVYSRF